jgi:hypothetical protein
VTRALHLTRETLTELTTGELTAVVGGNRITLDGEVCAAIRRVITLDITHSC